MTPSLDDVLSEKKPEAPAKEPAAEVPVKEPAAVPEAPAVERATSRRAEHRKKELEAQGRDPETGQFLSKEPEKKAEPEKPKEPEKPAAPPKAAEPAKPADTTEGMTPKEKAAFAAAADERRKRQALEQELARYRQQQAPQPLAPAKPQSFWDDPEGAFKTEEQKRNEHSAKLKLQFSEMIARSKYNDFDDTIDEFVELAKAIPGLAQQIIAAPDPAEFAYRTAKSHISIKQAGSVDKLLAEHGARVRAEERAKVEAEFKAKQDEIERQRSALTPSLSDTTGTGRRTVPTFTGPTPLEDILK